MFYSHDILTDRKHGVATIWLVATLGSRSLLRKVSRKAIMDVNVPDACETIVDPEAPMALRLQGSLLFGVTRVFQQQCTYMLTDTQSLKDKMRSVAIAFHDLAIDPDVSAMRSEQLNLQINPTFNIELDLGLDLSTFDLSFSSNESSSFMSPRTVASSQTSFIGDEEAGVPMQEPLPAASSSDDQGGYEYGNDDFMLGDEEQYQQRHVQQEPELPPAVVEEDMFQMQEDGSLVMRESSNQIQSDDVGGFELGVPELPMQDYDLDLDVGNDVQADLPAPISIAEEVNLPLINDEVAPTDPGPPVPASPSTADAEREVVQTIEDVDSEESGDHNEDVAVVTARQKRNRPIQAIPVDNPTQIPNRTLADWQNTYSDTMNAAANENNDKITLAQAKRNAAHWVIGHGISGLGGLGLPGEHPLAAFSGQQLLDSLASPAQAQGGRKRSSSAVVEEYPEEERRRVRVRPENDEIDDGVMDNDVVAQNANEDIAQDDDGGNVDVDDDFEPEIGRRQEEPLPDHPDSMPWNIYAASSSKQASRQGSVCPFMSAAAASSSAGGRGGFSLGPGSIASRRFSRLIPESPLEHRNRLLRQSSIVGSVRLGSDDLGGTGDDLAYDNFDNYELDRQLAANLGDITNFELPDPGAELSTQRANNSQLVASILEQEAYNFLGFVQAKIAAKEAEQAEGAVGETSVAFEELLPSYEQPRAVAAQGLLHVLSLATQDLLHVRQENEEFGDIFISIVVNANEDEDEVLV